MSIANKVRTRLLDHYNLTNCAMVLADMIGVLLNDTPSCFEVACCKHAKSKTHNIAFLGLNNGTFRDDFANLERAIMDNFPEDVPCVRCNSTSQISRKFGEHIFVEVLQNRIVF